MFSSSGAKHRAFDGAAPPSLTDPVGGSAGAKPRVSDGAAPPSLTDPVGGSAGAKARASDGAAPPSLTDPVGASARANSPTAPSSSDAPCSKNLAASAGNGETTKPPEYPRRSGVADCSYYVKFGTCGYGMKCWFNHPDLPATGGGGQSQASNPSEHNKKMQR